jgi:hypothetical protein
MSNLVILDKKPNSYYKDINNEPEIVQSRSVSSAYIYLDSNDTRYQLDKTNMLLSSVKSLNSTPNQLSQNIVRLAVKTFSSNWITPNVNARNNTLTIYSSVTSSFHTVTIPEKFYATPALIMAAIVTVLNSISGTTGLTFSEAAASNSDLIRILTATGGMYYIKKDCSAVLYGTELYNMPVNESLNTYYVIGSFGMKYTRYIDICSQRLLQYTKHKNTTTGNNNNMVLRIYIQEFSEPFQIGVFAQNPGYWAWEPTDNIYDIDFQINDQWGNSLYIPDGALGTSSGFNWEMSLEIEV